VGGEEYAVDERYLLIDLGDQDGGMSLVRLAEADL